MLPVQINGRLGFMSIPPCGHSNLNKQRSVPKSRNQQAVSRHSHTQENTSTQASLPMCYLEDVYYSVCGHWGKARVYSKCPNAGRDGFSRGCWNRQRTTSAREDSTCEACQASKNKERPLT